MSTEEKETEQVKTPEPPAQPPEENDNDEVTIDELADRMSMMESNVGFLTGYVQAKSEAAQQEQTEEPQPEHAPKKSGFPFFKFVASIVVLGIVGVGLYKAANEPKSPNNGGAA